MTVRFPNVQRRLGLGVGLDLPWGAPIGFERDEEAGDRIAPRVVRYLNRHHEDFSYLFVSWQPRSRNRLALEDYIDVWDDLFAQVPAWPVRALHQTAMNLGALEPYDTGEVVAFTNALIARYDLAWVNEDLGLWSLHGRPLPYPLPPYLTDEGLAAAIRNTEKVQEALTVPLLVEFPGFSDGTSFCIGNLHAYDFFRQLAEATASPVTLDTGHLMSYQWLCGKRGEDLFTELDRLPLDHCFEIHLSGCAIKDERFMDYHHGILMDEQLELLERLLVRCPNLRAVTYEDPKFSRQGVMTKGAVKNVERLKGIVGAWAS